MSAIIECINISKTYNLNTEGNTNGARIIKALNNVSFTLNEGDRLGLIGLNGSGKSTLLKILGGFIKPSSGKAILHKKVTSLSSFDSILHPDLNAIENCRLQLQVLGFKQADIPKAIDQIIEFSELTNFMYQPVKTFSSGMMLRLSFSIFSVTKPEVLLLDEVFSSGDINFQRKASELMLQSFKSTPAIIMASHQLSEIQQYCNKCLVLQKGNITFHGTVDDALKTYYTKNNKAKTVYYSEKVLVEVLKISSESIKTSESIKINIRLKQLVNDLAISPAIYVSNVTNKILTDSPVYSQSYTPEDKQAGIYDYEVELGPNLLNVGSYSVSIYIGNRNDVFVQLLNCFLFEITSDDWEKTAEWDIPTDYPIRTRLNWRINKC